MKRFICWCFIYFFALFLAGEIYLRITGYELKYTRFVPDCKLGWKGSGDGDIHSDEDPSVIEHVWKNGMRRCREDIDKPCSKRVAIFGCSYTYGQGVEDEETYAWKLNSLFPDVAFDNYGVCGYGPYQCYLSMKDILSQQKIGKIPKYDMILYSVWHGQMERNIAYALRKRYGYVIKLIDDNYKMAPWVELHDGKLVEYAPKAWPEYIKVSYLLTFIARANMGIDRYHMDDLERDDYIRKVFVKVVEKMASLGKEYDIPIVLCLLTNEEKDIFRDTIVDGVIVAEMPLKEFQDPNNVKYRVRNQPRFHPNGEAHTYWAEHMATFLREHNLP